MAVCTRAVLVSMSSVALLVGGTTVASAADLPSSKRVDGVCASTMSGSTTITYPSQNFQPALDGFDSVIADDVRITGSACRLRQVSIAGQYYNGVGNPRSQTVTIYENDRGRPGEVISTQTVVGVDSGGSFVIPIDTVRLPRGRAWVSVQINMDADDGVQWGWLTRDPRDGRQAMFQNPGDGLGTGCVDWGRLLRCMSQGDAAATGADMMMELSEARS